jgi:hypothetical protein
MAETKAKKTATKKAAANEDIVETVDFDDKDLDKSVVIYNIAGWNVTFALRNREGDVLLTKKSKQRLPRNEIQAQIYNGNKLFSGTDGNGSHATIYIEDKATRILGFEKDMEGMKELVNVKQEQIDALLSEKNNLERDNNAYCKNYILLKERAILRKKIIFGLCGVITILVFILMMII